MLTYSRNNKQYIIQQTIIQTTKQRTSYEQINNTSYEQVNNLSSGLVNILYAQVIEAKQNNNISYVQKKICHMNKLTVHHVNK